MFCEKCGATLEQDMTHCPICGVEAPAQPAEEERKLPAEPMAEAAAQEPEMEPPEIPEPAPQPKEAPAPKQKKPYRPRRKPHIAQRMLLQFLSFVLCIVLTASLLGTVVLADLNHIMSAGGIKQLITAVLNPTPAPRRLTPVVGAAGVYREETAPGIPGFLIPGDLDIDDIPDDLLTGGDSEENIGSIIDWLYAELEKNSQEPLPITKEQVQEFVQDSTLSDFVAEKLAGFAEDFLNGTENTVITTEEVMALLDENSRLIEKTFDVQLTAELKQQLSESVEKMVVENDLNTVIREEIFETVKDAVSESTVFSWEQLQPTVQLVCSDAVLYAALGITLVLMLLLCLLNFYNVPAGLTWIALPSIFLGAILTAPLVLLQASPELLNGLLPGGMGPMIASFAGVLLPIHGGLLALGLGLLLIGIIWRMIRATARRKRLAAA